MPTSKYDNLKEGILKERIYGGLLVIADNLENHGFSKSLTQRDATAINVAIKEIKKQANRLYLAKQELVKYFASVPKEKKSEPKTPKSNNPTLNQKEKQ